MTQKGDAQKVSKSDTPAESRKLDKVEFSDEELARRARNVGSDVLVEEASVSDVRRQILLVFESSDKKYLTAKQVHHVMQFRQVKFFNDTLWAMRRDGQLVVEARGQYRLPTPQEKQEFAEKAKKAE